MKNSFEIVFENVSMSRIGELVGELLSHARETELIEFSDDTQVGDGKAITPDLLTARLLSELELTATIRVRRFATTAATIDLVLIRVIKYDDVVDLEMSFDIDENENPTTIMHALHEYSLRIANLFSTGDVYGGMEPATDFATRYFTNHLHGPLPLDSN